MTKIRKHISVLSGLAVIFCVNTHADEQFNVPQVDLAIKTNGEYIRVNEYDVPKDHIIGDGTIAYEGPGIESAKVAYRLYLDERSVLDVFGKKTPGPVLQKVGRGDDYHAMSDWGMDILKVGNSLGSGGLGVYENGTMRMVGQAQNLSIKVSNESPDTASFTVTHEGLDSLQGAFNLETQYSMSQQSRLLTIQSQSSGSTPVLAGGLVIHPGVEFIESTGNEGANWAYIATYGVQTLADDELGLALFYKTNDGTRVENDGTTFGVIFDSDRPVHYKVAAAWVAEPNGISDLVSFKSYLVEELKRLESNHTSD